MTLRRRVMVAMVTLVALFTLIQGGLAVLSMHLQEDELVDDLVLAVSRRFATRIEQTGPDLLADRRLVMPDNYEAWWIGKDGVAVPGDLPPTLLGLSEGPHLDSDPEGEYHIMVTPAAGGRLVVRYNAAANETKVHAFAVQVFMLALFFIAMAAWIARYVARLLIVPLEKVAQLLDHWAPASNLKVTVAVDEERRLLDAFQRVQIRWEHGLARESERLADIHHEIRTPLAALRTDLEMLQSLGQDPKGSLAHSASEAMRAQRLQRSLTAVDAITGALESMRALRTGEAVPAERVPLVDCVDDAWASLGEVPTERGLNLSNGVDPQAFAIVDRQALMAILRNLFRNAAEHAAPALLRVRYANERMVVADDGPGIPLEEMPSVFDRYYRGRLADAPDAQQADSSANDYGRGLGLAIARQVAEANGWRLSVEAAHPKGTQFVISFGDSAAL